MAHEHCFFGDGRLSLAVDPEVFGSIDAYAGPHHFEHDFLLRYVHTMGLVVRAVPVREVDVLVWIQGYARTETTHSFHRLQQLLRVMMHVVVWERVLPADLIKARDEEQVARWSVVIQLELLRESAVILKVAGLPGFFANFHLDLITIAQLVDSGPDALHQLVSIAKLSAVIRGVLATPLHEGNTMQFSAALHVCFEDVVNNILVDHYNVFAELVALFGLLRHDVALTTDLRINLVPIIS